MFAADPRNDVEGAYAAWDVAFNKSDAKSIAAAYLPNAKLLPPDHEIALGQAAIEILCGSARQWNNGSQA
jgi:ketosteroid isomerase-like protein